MNKIKLYTISLILIIIIQSTTGCDSMDLQIREYKDLCNNRIQQLTYSGIINILKNQYDKCEHKKDSKQCVINRLPDENKIRMQQKIDNITIDIKNKDTMNIKIFKNIINPKKCTSIFRNKDNKTIKHINNFREIIEMPIKISSDEDTRKYTQSTYICCGDQCIEKDRLQITSYIGKDLSKIESFSTIELEKNNQIKQLEKQLSKKFDNDPTKQSIQDEIAKIKQSLVIIRSPNIDECEKYHQDQNGTTISRECHFEIFDEISIGEKIYNKHSMINSNNDHIKNKIKSDLLDHLKIQQSKSDSHILEEPTVSNTHLIQSQKEEKDFITEYKKEKTYNTEAIIISDNNKDIIGATAYLNENNDQKCTAKIIRSDGTIEEFQGTSNNMALLYNANKDGVCGIRVNYITACQDDKDNNKIVGVNKGSLLLHKEADDENDQCEHGEFQLFKTKDLNYNNFNKQRLISFNKYNK